MVLMENRSYMVLMENLNVNLIFTIKTQIEVPKQFAYGCDKFELRVLRNILGLEQLIL